MTRARRAPRTTEADPTAARAPDLVGRRWRVAAPNLLVVADFTYVPMTWGFGYTAFVVDAYAGLIAGLEVLADERTGPSSNVHCATPRRSVPARATHLNGAIHHSDYAEVCVKPRICGDRLPWWGLLVDSSA